MHMEVGMKTKTLYVSDLDGTLLTPEECLSPFTAETIKKLTAEGMLFSYATARSLTTAKKVTGALGNLHIPVILNNGGTIADAADGRVLEGVYFSAEERDFVRQVLDAAELSPIVYARTGDSVDTERVSYVPENRSAGMLEYLRSRKGDPRFRAVQGESLYDSNIFYFTIIRDTQEELKAAAERMQADGRFAVYFDKNLYDASWWLEIVPKRTTKANAVKRLAELYGCGRIVCFGDGSNDVSMFRIADAGYAVANASDVLKAQATAVIGANTEDGVAHKLLELWEQANK